jgi:hypothetical protein
MHDFLLWSGGIIVTVGSSITAWVISMIFARIDKLDSRHNDLETRFDGHRLYAAENYTTKKDVKDAKDEIIRVIERLEDKMSGK